MSGLPVGRKRMAMYWVTGLVVFLLLAMTACQQEQASELPALGTRLELTTVSGLSAGAYMAGQFQIARSSIVKGAAIIAGGPYGCAETTFADLMPGPGTAFLNLSKAVNGCMRNALAVMGIPDPKQLAQRARALSKAKRIDPVSAVLDDKVYLFTGRNDATVLPPIVEAARRLYVELGVPSTQIKMIDSMPAGHGFVVEDAKLKCDVTESPYIVDCDYDQAGELLRHLLTELNAPSTSSQGTLSTFDQRPFFKNLVDHGLDETGLVYIPDPCRDRATHCRAHVVFHGCNQGRSEIGNVFAEASGYARWADTNRLVVLFPQIEPSPTNPHGCWDWWGYTGGDYLTRSAPQIIAVGRMLDRLSTSPGS